MASIRKRTWRNDDGSQRIAWLVDYWDSQGNRRRKQFARRREADKFRIAIEGQLSNGTYRSGADKLTVAVVCEKFLENCEARMRRDERMTRKTFVVYKGHVRNHILGLLGISDCKLSQLTPRVVGDFRDRLRDAGVSVPTTRKILATLHTVLEHGISQDFVAVNAARKIRVIGSRSEGSKEVKPPGKSELKTLLQNAEPDLRLKILFAASTGVRAGEQWALRWCDLDLEFASVGIERRVDAYGSEGSPKTVSGVRTIPLSRNLCFELTARKVASAFSQSDDLVFCNRGGRYVCHDNIIKRHFKPVVAQSGIAGLTWHSLRHFAISTWIEAGLSPKAVQTFAGHSSLQVTMDRYGHLFPSQDHQKVMDHIAGDLIG